MVKWNKVPFFHSLHWWRYESNTTWFQSVWITSLRSQLVFAVWHSWSWKIERGILPGHIHWTFTAPSCEQCHPHVQPGDLTGIPTPIPCCSQWIIQDCSDPYIWSRCATKIGWDAGCFVHHISSQWIHSDTYTNCDLLTTSHHYLDSSWDFANETIHATCLRKHAHDLLHHRIADSKGDTHSTSHIMAQQTVDPPLKQEGHPAPLVVSAPAPASKGATFSDTDIENDPLPNPSSQNTTISWLLDTVDHADFMNQPDNILKAPPLPIPAPMTLGKQGASLDFGCMIPIVSQFGSIELRLKQLRKHSTFTNIPSDSSCTHSLQLYVHSLKPINTPPLHVPF